MRRTLLTAFVLLLLALFLHPTAGFAAAPSGPSTDGPTADIDNGPTPVGTNATTITLYEQMPTTEVVSALYGSFTDADRIYADDFTIPAGQTWTITDVAFDLDIPASAFYTNTVKVIIYGETAGNVGSPLCTYNGVTPGPIVAKLSTTKLPVPCVLGAGNYWFSATPVYTCTFFATGCDTGGIPQYVPSALRQMQSNVCGTFQPLDICTPGLPALALRFGLYNVSNDALQASAACDGDNLDVTITDGDGPFLIEATGSNSPSEPTTVSSTGTYTLTGPDRWDNLQVTEQGGDGETASLGIYNCVNLNGSIIIPDGAPTTTAGIATPYPATTTLSGLPSVITDVNLSVNGLGHSFPADVEILLVSPAGTAFVVMADVCLSYGGRVFDFIFDDEASGSLTTSNGCVSGTYRRSVSETQTFPSPAPDGPYVTSFAGFDGENPNGTWSLYVYDDGGSDVGDIESWSLDITSSYIDLAATAVCNGNNLEVAITDGDGTYNITGSGPGLPINGVTSGQVLNGPAVWTGVTVTETTSSDAQSQLLGDFSCTTDTPGLAFSAVNPFEVDEEGPTSTSYFVALNTAPTATVTVDLTVDAQCTLSTNQLTFTTADWNITQQITVTAVDDVVAEGTHSCVVNHASSSTFATYNGLSEDLTFTVLDNDTTGIVVLPGRLIAVESGQPTYFYTIQLGSSPASGETVTVTMPGNPQLATLAPRTFAFTDANWNVPQVVTVQALDDGIAEGVTTETIPHTATSSDGGSPWNGVSADVIIEVYDFADSGPYTVPNLGEIMITAQQVQQPYDSPAGQPIYLPTGGELFLPFDYDGNGFDTYTVTDFAQVGDTLWFGIFIGNRYWIWVPETAVTILRMDYNAK